MSQKGQKQDTDIHHNALTSLNLLCADSQQSELAMQEHCVGGQ